MTEWGPWIEHDQSAVPPEVLGRWIEVDCMHLNGEIDRDQFHHPTALSLDWINVWSVGFISEVTGKPLVVILRYRIRKPRALTQLEQIAKGIREPEGVEA